MNHRASFRRKTFKVSPRKDQECTPKEEAWRVTGFTPRSAPWIDELNDMEKGGKKVDGLHYTNEGYNILGKQFAENAIALINKE